MEAPINESLEVVAKDGDLILYAGDPEQEDERLQILVSSHVLASVSKVFAALLGPQFLEGQQVRSSASPQMIVLPEDEAAAMLDLCRLLHGDTATALQAESDPVYLYRLAVLIDKYGLVEHLRTQSQGLMFHSLDKCSPEASFMGDDLLNIAAAAYHLNHDRCFRISTGHAIRYASEPFYRPLSGFIKDGENSMFPEARETLPAEVLHVLDHRRLIARDMITYRLPDLFKWLRCNKDGFFRCRLLIPWEALRKVFNVQSWPPGQTVTISAAVKNMEALPGLRMSGCATHDVEDTIQKEDVQQLIDELNELCNGLCLRCVREGKSLLMPCQEDGHYA